MKKKSNFVTILFGQFIKFHFTKCLSNKIRLYMVKRGGIHPTPRYPTLYNFLKRNEPQPCSFLFPYHSIVKNSQFSNIKTTTGKSRYKLTYLDFIVKKLLSRNLIFNLLTVREDWWKVLNTMEHRLMKRRGTSFN